MTLAINIRDKTTRIRAGKTVGRQLA